ncbi:MAG: hypothetical protein QY304_03465 [Candidatus Paceibacterota bacterium]|nr:MAG: hypothetical protein QY304_03465 [Candidatus Paceibacterota bacterium]
MITDNVNEVSSAKRKFLEKVGRLTADYRREVQSVAAVLEKEHLSRLSEELKNS